MSAAHGAPLDAAFYARPVLDVARDLIGCVVLHGDCAGVIVETEAYHDSEPACHAHVGMTARTSTLFGRGGRAYVYRSYGIHAMLNTVAEREGVGAAALLRALEPLAGIDAMRERRGLDRLDDLCSGPGKLTQALGIELSENETDLTGCGPITVCAPAPGDAPPPVATAVRIGITKAVDLPWRFAVPGNRFVSRPRPEGRT